MILSLVEKVKWLALNKIDLIDDSELDALVDELKIKYEGAIKYILYFCS